MWSKDKVPPVQSVSSFAKQWVGIDVLKTYHQSYHKNLVRHTNHSLQVTVTMGMFNGQVEKSHSWDFWLQKFKSSKKFEHICKEKLQNISRVFNETSNTDSTGTSSKDTKCSLSEALDEEQTTKTECKSERRETHR